MMVRNKHTGEVFDVGEGVLEVLNAFMVPARCLLKEDYEKIDKERNDGK